jgi:hypothetical protein
MGSNVFVNYIPVDTSEADCRAEFEKYGSIISLKVIQHAARNF